MCINIVIVKDSSNKKISKRKRLVMKINYLFSRVDRVNGFNDNQKKYLKEDMNNNMSITFIASLFD